MAPETKYSHVCAPWWDEVVIVAGGPSAVNFDFDRVGNRRLLLVNDGYKRLTVRTLHEREWAAFSVDPGWIRRHSCLLEVFLGDHYACLPLETHPECAGIRGVTYLQRDPEAGLSLEPTHLRTGGNSGYAAINLAVLKRARSIYLVGYDMDPLEEKFRSWAPKFDAMVPQLSDLGVKVLNCNPKSHITAFPRGNFL